MKVETKHLVYLSLFVLIGWVLYIGRAVLTPFVVAAIFAYLLNPLVNLLSHRTKLPRALSITVIYIVLIGAIAVLFLNLGAHLAEESSEFAREAQVFIQQADSQIINLPVWLQPTVRDVFDSVRASLLWPHGRVITYLPGAVNRTISILVFLIATFYFLKDGRLSVGNFLAMFPDHARKEIAIIGEKISKVLGYYLRGQLLLIAIMSTLTYVGLLLIGVRYALILSVFTGFAEIIPLVGPVVAAGVTILVAYTDQFSRIGANPLGDAVAVAALYTVLRQMEDLFIIPQVMGKLTKLHPLVVLASVLVGGQLFGVIGYVIAVPVIASIRIIYEHLFDLLD